MKVIFVLPIFFISLNIFAFTKDCSAVDSSLKYHFDSPDGGAPRWPNESLSLGSQILIDTRQDNDVAIRDASIVFADRAEWESKQEKQGDYIRTKSVVNASVFKNTDQKSNQKPIFDDLIFCETTIYNGDPLP